MSHRNLPSVPQHQRGGHTSNCGCMQGHHIWDLDYEKETRGEKWCVCCEHFYHGDDFEADTLDDGIEMPSTTSNKKPSPKSERKPGGLNKGKIKRRS